MTQENSNKNHSANAEKSDADTSQSLGAYFQRERQKKQLTIKEVADVTRIPPETLQAMEAGHRHLLPVSVFTKGFVKIYAAHLGLNQAEILERFSNEWGAVENTTPEILSGESMAETSPFYLSIQFYFVVFLIALIVGLAYFFFQADDTPTPVSQTSVPSSLEQPGEQLAVKTNSVKQLEIISTVPSQENLLISPQSAGKIILAENESPQNAPLVQAKTGNTDSPLQQTLSPSQENTAKADETRAQTARVVPSQTPAIKKKESVTSMPKPSFFESVKLHIRFIKRTHISVAQDDGQPEKFIFAPGEESTWQAASHISLNIDDADAVELTLNGSPVTVNHTNSGPLAITLPGDRAR